MSDRKNSSRKVRFGISHQPDNHPVAGPSRTSEVTHDYIITDDKIPDDSILLTPDDPVKVEDELHTASRLVKSRSLLVECVELLAIRVREALDKDLLQNHRYATKMTLCNRIKHPDRKWDIFKVELPRNEFFWNDLDVIDLECRIIQSILTNVDERCEYYWYKLHVSIDEFMKSKVKPLIDKLNENYECEREVLKKARIKQFQREQQRRLSLEQRKQKEIPREEKQSQDEPEYKKNKT